MEFVVVTWIFLPGRVKGQSYQVVRHSSLHHLVEDLRLRRIVVALADKPLIEHRLQLRELLLRRLHWVICRGRSRLLCCGRLYQRRLLFG